MQLHTSSQDTDWLLESSQTQDPVFLNTWYLFPNQIAALNKTYFILVLSPEVFTLWPTICPSSISQIFDLGVIYLASPIYKRQKNELLKLRVWVYESVCMCVCVRERERERERGGGENQWQRKMNLTGKKL